MLSKVFTRSLATAKSVKPPVQLFGIDGTYASALYLAAAQDSLVSKAFKDLGEIKLLMELDPKVAEFLTSPVLSKEDRDVVVKTVSDKLSLDATTGNFLKVLADNNRLSLFGSIYNKFGILNDASAGIVEATITLAKPLDSKILKRLQQLISKSSVVGDSKQLKVTNQVNPDILGGLIVDVADKTVDLSISAKVARLNQSLSESL